jgi:toxin-antitoxin system PIN domain toxin
VILPDVNVLVYSFRQDAPDHPSYREWLHAVVNGDSAYGLSPQVLSSFVRVCTHLAIFAEPSQLNEALDFCRLLMEQPHCQLVQPGVRHWSIFADLCRHVQASGNLVQDAWFAALAIENGCEWITTDRDYSRFPGLRWRPPF